MFLQGRRQEAAALVRDLSDRLVPDCEPQAAECQSPFWQTSRLLQVVAFPVMLEVSSPKVAWLLILVSGVLEVAFASSLQLSNGFTRLVPATAALGFGALSVYVMSLSLGRIPIGTAYAVWAGIGAVGTVVVGLVAFGESASPVRLLCIAFIVAGIIGLQLTGSA